MTKYIFRIRLPFPVDENVLRSELASMMRQLIAQSSEVPLDVEVKYQASDYDIETGWEAL